MWGEPVPILGAHRQTDLPTFLRGVLHLRLEVREHGLPCQPALLAATHTEHLGHRVGGRGRLGVSELQETVSPVARLGKLGTWAFGTARTRLAVPVVGVRSKQLPAGFAAGDGT